MAGLDNLWEVHRPGDQSVDAYRLLLQTRRCELGEREAILVDHVVVLEREKNKGMSPVVASVELCRWSECVALAEVMHLVPDNVLVEDMGTQTLRADDMHEVAPHMTLEGAGQDVLHSASEKAEHLVLEAMEVEEPANVVEALLLHALRVEHDLPARVARSRQKHPLAVRLEYTAELVVVALAEGRPFLCLAFESEKETQAGSFW